MTMRPSREAFVQRIESAVLNALDDTVSAIAKEEFSGWKDADVGVFIPGIRQHAHNLFDRIMLDKKD